MSQNQKPHLYLDSEWVPRQLAAERFLRDATDYWFRIDDPFPSPAVVAVLFHIFSPRFSPHEQTKPRRTVSQWFQMMGDPAVEIARGWPKRTDHAELVRMTTDIMTQAAQKWESHGLADPTVEVVIEQFTDVLFAKHYVALRHG